MQAEIQNVSNQYNALFMNRAYSVDMDRVNQLVGFKTKDLQVGLNFHSLNFLGHAVLYLPIEVISSMTLVSIGLSTFAQ